ncbi:MAG: aldo/keto reductase [Candidatus Aminicenantes bacterium]|nr:aldo/keto reductase [Acidobacteriota bacterium]MCG2810630.1 aldo/keto reductase [Candidatus Aminicenantes bacterium]
MKKEKKGYSRREFILKTVGGAAAVGLIGNVGLKLAAVDAKNTRPITRVLGRTGLRIPVVSMGVMNADNPALLKRSFELGIRHFDTAARYQNGRNEEMVGSVLMEMKVREQAIIATKVRPSKPEILDQMGDKMVEQEILDLLDKSLARLQTDYVDILYIHAINDPKELKRPGLLSALDKAKKMKKVRFAGFSTHQRMTECLEAAALSKQFDVILTVINYSMADDKALLEAMKKAAGAGIGLVAMKTQCKQSWGREGGTDTNLSKYDRSLVNSALLKWALRLESVTTAIPGYTTFQQLETDWPVAYNLEYSPDEVKFLADRDVRLALGSVCRQCAGCVGTCPSGVDIPTLLRAHMYAADYNNFLQARQTLAEIQPQAGLKNCVDCRECKVVCVRGVKIARRLEELKTIFA